MQVLSILRTVLTGIIRSKEVSNLKGVLELLLYDCIIHDALISILSVNAQELEVCMYCSFLLLRAPAFGNKAYVGFAFQWLEKATDVEER